MMTSMIQIVQFYSKALEQL